MSNTKQETNLILGDIKFGKGNEIYVLRICATVYPLLFSLMNQLIGKVGILEEKERKKKNFFWASYVLMIELGCFHPLPCLSSGKISIAFFLLLRKTEFKEASRLGKWRNRYLTLHISVCKVLVFSSYFRVVAELQNDHRFLWLSFLVLIDVWITWGGKLSDLHFRLSHSILEISC